MTVGRKKGHLAKRPVKNSLAEKVVRAVERGKYLGSKTELAELCGCSIGVVMHTFRRWLPHILEEEENERNDRE